MQLDDERGVVRQKPAVGPHFGGEELSRQQRRPMRAQECPPRHRPFAARRGARSPQKAPKRALPHPPPCLPTFFTPPGMPVSPPVGFSVPIRITSPRIRACSPRGLPRRPPY